MKKVAIVTICDMDNYGNRLQNYAMQSILEQFGCKVYTIFLRSKLYPAERRMKHMAMKLTGYRLPTDDKGYWKNGIYRYYAFEKDCKGWNHLYYLKDIAKPDRLAKLDRKFDYFVVGSDQVWNTAWYPYNPGIENLYLASFAPPEKRIAVAPSFGMDELPDCWKLFFTEQLSQFRCLSCREKRGAEIIKELTGRDAEVLIDPTLMLDASDWNQIARKTRHIDCQRDYILTYFLGDVPDQAGQLLSELEEKTRDGNEKIQPMEVYRLAASEVQALYRTGPAEFLYLISHARLVLTDSFHACVFSFLYGKPFLVYAREGKETGMFSRIETFLETFRLERKYADSKEENDVFECDYREGRTILAAEREKMNRYLREALGTG